jgi:hypothetical protein
MVQHLRRRRATPPTRRPADNGPAGGDPEHGRADCRRRQLRWRTTGTGPRCASLDRQQHHGFRLITRHDRVDTAIKGNNRTTTGITRRGGFGFGAPIHHEREPRNGQWYLTGTDTAANEVRIYVNGTLVSTQATAATPAVNAQNLAIGRRNPGGAGEEFAGLLDEVRVENVTRSLDWIRAQHLSMTDASYVSYGAAQSAPATGGVLDNDLDPTNDPLRVVEVNGVPGTSAFRPRPPRVAQSP